MPNELAEASVAGFESFIADTEMSKVSKSTSQCQSVFIEAG